MRCAGGAKLDALRRSINVVHAGGGQDRAGASVTELPAPQRRRQHTEESRKDARAYQTHREAS